MYSGMLQSNGHPLNDKKLKNKPKKISIALDQDILKKLDEGKFNKSKLIDSLLTEHFKNKIRTNTNTYAPRRLLYYTCHTRCTTCLLV